MLQSLHIENFRGFREFNLENLGKINLLVGENNSGKTSILEAISRFCSHGNLNVISELMKSRGEYLWETDRQGNREREYAIRHLFYGHEILPDTKLRITVNNENSQKTMFLSFI